MKISVIVPVYNSGQYLERVLQALSEQDYPTDQYELIFVDNGSTDDSVAILKQQTNILLLSESERGSYAACRGLQRRLPTSPGWYVPAC